MSTEETQEQITEEVSPSALLPVRMTAWDWHCLLIELQGLNAVCNRDNSNVRILYRKVASQLAGHDAGLAERDDSKESLPPDDGEFSKERTSLLKRVFGKGLL
jgi:hypothetical protein